MNICETCDFDVWNYVGKMNSSYACLYDDARFPGRMIIALHEHYENLETVPSEMLSRFMADIQKAIIAIKEVTGVDRVNFAILGNTVPHVHAHLIPRYPDMEELPGKSPWNDKRPVTFLEESVKQALMKKLQERLDLE